MKGQTLFGEQYGEPFPHCPICFGELEEKGFGTESVEYCPNCQFYCDICKDAFYITEDSDSEAIHYSSHETNDENNDDNNNDDNNDNNNNDSAAGRYFICLSCLNSPIFTEKERDKHFMQYGHKYYKDVSF